MLKTVAILLLLGLLPALFSIAATAGNTLEKTLGKNLEKVKQRGEVACGVTTGLAGFSLPDSKGKWRGMDVDYCRALAAAVLGDAEKVRYVPLSAQQRFTALQSGEIDVLSRNTTWTLSRDTNLGINFAGTLVYGGQGFLVPKEFNLKNISELEGASICIQSGTTNELNVADYFRKIDKKVETVVFESFQESVNAFFSGRCDAYTEDVMMLAVIRANNAADAEKYDILSETISKEPLGPSVVQGDVVWFNIAKWVLFALIEAEELGINSQNISSFKATQNPVLQRFLGQQGELAKGLGLNNSWTTDIITQVGNYGEIFERNLTPLGLDRTTANNGLNQLYKDGGLLYSPPFR